MRLMISIAAAALLAISAQAEAAKLFIINNLPYNVRMHYITVPKSADYNRHDIHDVMIGKGTADFVDVDFYSVQYSYDTEMYVTWLDLMDDSGHVISTKRYYDDTNTQSYAGNCRIEESVYNYLKGDTIGDGLSFDAMARGDRVTCTHVSPSIS